MTAPFNPYQHWLGYTGAERPRTFYELLGLKHHEKNIQRIAKTADELLAKVRSLPPGDHFLEWEQLVTEIQVAKNCLCNPKYKEEYDATHPAPVQAAPSPLGGNFPQNMAPPFVNSPVNSPMVPPQVPPANVFPQAPATVLPGQPVSPGMPLAGYPSGIPTAGYPGSYPGMPASGVPVQPGSYPGMVSPTGMVQPVMTPGVPQGMPPGLPPQQAPAAYGVFPQQPVMPQGMPVQPISQPVVTSSSSSRYASNKPSYSHSKSSSSRGTQNNATQRNIIAIVGLGLVMLLGWLLYGKMDQAPEIRVERLETTSPSPQNSPSVSPSLSRPKKSMANNFAQATPAASKFQEVREDLARQDIAQARIHLQEAQTLCQKDAERQELNRLSNITDLIENFVKSIHDAMGKFEPTVAMQYFGEEFNISE